MEEGSENAGNTEQQEEDKISIILEEMGKSEKEQLLARLIVEMTAEKLAEVMERLNRPAPHVMSGKGM